MKTLFTVICIFICCFIISAYRDQSPDSYNDSTLSPLYGFVPDTILSLVEDKPALFYSCGHYGYSWALITKQNKDIRALSGRVNYSGKKSLTDQFDFNQIDSIKLFSSNEALISWGFDSIAKKVLKMRPIKREHYVTIYENLLLMNSEGVVVFDSNDAQVFSGPDSLEFNHNFHKLCLLMRWLAEPEIRQYISNDVILD